MRLSLRRLIHIATAAGTLGVTVCYDLRFPELYTQLVQDMGADVLLVPSAFTVPTGQAHWHTLLRGTCDVFLSSSCSSLVHPLVHGGGAIVQHERLRTSVTSLPRLNTDSTMRSARRLDTPSSSIRGVLSSLMQAPSLPRRMS